MGLFDWRKKAPSPAETEKGIKFISTIGSIPISSLNPEAIQLWDNSIVMASIKWVTRVFPESPLITEKLDKDRWEVARDHALTKLIRRPNECYSGNLLLNGVLLSLLVDGNAYIVKMRNSAGVVKELWYAPHFTILPIVKPGSTFVDYYIYRANGQTYNLDPADVIHFRDGIDPAAPYMGLSGLRSAIPEIRADTQISIYTHAILKNGGVPSVVMTPKDSEGSFTQDTAEAISERFSKRFTSGGQGAPLILDGALDIKPLGFSPKDLAIDEMRNGPESRICAVLGIHPAVLGLQVGLEHSTFSNMAEARMSAYESLIIPLQQLVCTALDTQLLDDLGDPETERTRFDLSEVRILQEDDQAKRERMVELYQGGILKRSEARSALGYDYQPEDEIYFTDIQVQTAINASQEAVVKSLRARAAERRRKYEETFGKEPEEAA